MISGDLQKIYNTYLAVSRKSRNKPFKLRENFEGFESKTEYSMLIKLEYFFKRFPNINKETYFKAPYELWKDKDFFALDFYTTPVATRAYTLYKKQLLEQSPDNDANLEFIRESLMFIGKYCSTGGITLEQYFTHQSGATYDWMKHIRQNLISPYVVYGFTGVDDLLYRTPEDERDLLLGEFADKFYIYKQKYNESKLAKQLVVQGLQRVRLWTQQTNTLSGENTSNYGNIKKEESKETKQE
jgi:hypothetical protein